MKKLLISTLLVGTVLLSGCGTEAKTTTCTCTCNTGEVTQEPQSTEDTDPIDEEVVREEYYTSVPHDTVGTVVCDCIANTEILGYGGIANLKLNDVYTEPYELVQNGLAVYLHFTIDLYAGTGLAFDYNNFVLMNEDGENYYLPAYTSKVEFRQVNRNQSSKVNVEQGNGYFDRGDFDPENGTKQDFVVRYVIQDKLFDEDKLPKFEFLWKDPTSGGYRDGISVHLEH